MLLATGQMGSSVAVCQGPVVPLFLAAFVCRRLAKSSKTVVHITDEERVQSWRLFRKEGTYVLKYSTQDRLFQAAPQVC